MTEDRKRTRRLLALAGMWLLLAGLLTALGLVVVVFAVSALLLVASLAVIGVRQLRRLELREGVRSATKATGSALQLAREKTPKARAREVHVREHARELGAARGRGAAAPARTESFATRTYQAMYRFRLLRLPRSTPASAPTSSMRGAQLRRDGEPEQAAEQHLAALAIVRDLGDPHAEAMTLNNLRLALLGAEDAPRSSISKRLGTSSATSATRSTRRASLPISGSCTAGRATMTRRPACSTRRSGSFRPSRRRTVRSRRSCSARADRRVSVSRVVLHTRYPTKNNWPRPG